MNEEKNASKDNLVGQDSNISDSPMIAGKTSVMSKLGSKKWIILAAVAFSLAASVSAFALLRDSNESMSSAQEKAAGSEAASTTDGVDSADGDSSTSTDAEAEAARGSANGSPEELGLFESSYAETEGAEACAEKANFVDVSKFAGPGAGYASPQLSVTCTDSEFTVQSNNMPLWEFVELTPNDLEEQDYSWTLSRNPQIASTATQIGYQDASNSVLGTLGFTVSGLVWYGPTEGPFPDPYGDPYTNAIIDDCGGHAGPDSEYHEHILVTKCFFPDWTEDTPAPIVGYALDGFPIYGPTGYASSADSRVIELKSSYVETGSLLEYAWDNVVYTAGQGEGYLDECNGRVQPDGTYGYHVTSGFPYIIGCFKGTPSDVNAGGAGGGGQQQGSQQNGEQQGPTDEGQQQGPPGNGGQQQGPPGN